MAFRLNVIRPTERFFILIEINGFASCVNIAETMESQGHTRSMNLFEYMFCLYRVHRMLSLGEGNILGGIYIKARGELLS
ncbi:hypothetical protein SAMN05192532_105126 [Alteribacillus iranensis]|uniref:Uncharacterized protein n=1 Tax=Alteribacillus iranensis TaxID=930128 RepID=A0A1I2E5R7_9BACI|nr:hypothetical protein SAMN05192532_105126 [Alteribacillus iranensis]